MEVSLIMPRKDGTKKVFPVRNKTTILGRKPDCDLCIPLQEVSRRHCQLSCNDDLLVVRDLSSSNGTFLNGKKIEEEIIVKPGDTLQIGPVVFMIQIDGKPSDADISAMDTAIMQSPDIPEAEEQLNSGNTTVT